MKNFLHSSSDLVCQNQAKLRSVRQQAQINPRLRTSNKSLAETSVDSRGKIYAHNQSAGNFNPYQQHLQIDLPPSNEIKLTLARRNISRLMEQLSQQNCFSSGKESAIDQLEQFKEHVSRDMTLRNANSEFSSQHQVTKVLKSRQKRTKNSSIPDQSSVKHEQPSKVSKPSKSNGLAAVNRRLQKSFILKKKNIINEKM